MKKKNGVNGLIDYFINGTPDVGFTKQVNEKYITNERYDEIRDFKVFTDEHFKALNKLVEDTVSIYSSPTRNQSLHLRLT